MKGKQKYILTLFILLLFFCSCGMENTAKEAVEAERVVKEELVTEESVIEEPDEMPAIVFMFWVEYSSYILDINDPEYLIAFIDNEGNVYLLEDSCVNELTCMEIYDEFVEGKLNDVLTLDTTCKIDELRENYELLKGVTQNEKFELVPNSNYDLCVEVNKYTWLGFYYKEDGTLSFIEIREDGIYGAGITCLPNDERANQIYEWLASVSEVWK